MKLQCEIKLYGVEALLNVAINANTLHGRKIPGYETPTQSFLIPVTD